MLPNLSKLPLCNSTGYRAGVPVPNIWKPRRGLRGEAASLRAEAASLREDGLKRALRKALESLKECTASDGLKTQLAEETARVVQLDRALDVETLLRSVESKVHSLEETEFNLLTDGEKVEMLQGVADEVFTLVRKAAGVTDLNEKTKDDIAIYKSEIEQIADEIGYDPYQPDYVPFTPPAGNGG